MAHVNTIKNTQQTYTAEQLQQLVSSGKIDTTKITDVSVFSKSADPSQCTDGNDDGKIGFFDAIGSTVKGAVKGLVNGIKGCFTDENGKFSLLKTLKTAATVGACFIPGVGPVIATGLCAYGAVKGTVGIAKGVASAATAETDGEAKAAFESIGGNALSTGLSVAGLKASTSAIAANAKAASAEGVSAFQSASGVVGKLKGLAADAKLGVTNYYGSAWQTASGGAALKDMSAGQIASSAGKVLKQTAHDTGVNITNAAHSTKKAIDDKKPKFLKHKSKGAEGTPEAAAEGAAAPKTSRINKKMTELHDRFANTAVGKKVNAAKTAVDTKINAAKTSATNFYNSSVEAGYQGLPTTGGNLHYAGLTLASTRTGDEASNLNSNIALASTPYATVNSQSGYEFDLQDYTTLSQDEINKKYSDIMAQTRLI